MSGLTIEQVTQARIDARNNLDSETKTDVEDSNEQTETEDEVVESDVVDDKSTETPEEDIVEDDVEDTETVEDDNEESEELDNENTDSLDDGEELEYYQIGDIEATLEEIKEWKEGSLRQSDYTKKTQVLADDKKAFESDKAIVAAQSEDYKTKLAELSVLVDDNEMTVEEWDELKEYDPAEYLEKKEIQDKRKSALESKMKEFATPTHSQEYLQAEQAKVFKANPTWIDDKGQLTEAATKDLKNANDYLNKVGMTPEDRAGIVSSVQWQIILDAVKYKANDNKQVAIKKKFKKAPTVTKARAKVNTGNRADREISAARKAVKTNPSIDNLAKLRIVERKHKKK